MSDSTVAVETIEESLYTYHKARLHYLQSVHGNGGSPGYADAKSKLHIAVTNLYLTLQPYRSHNAIEQQWQDTVLFQVDGEEIGIDELGAAIESTEVVEEPKKMSTGVRQSIKTEQLEPQQSIRAGQILWELARNLGADIEKSLSETSKI